MNKNLNTKSLISLLKTTHNAEWEATPSSNDAIAWLDGLIQFLFPSNHLPKSTSYEGILKKNQIDLENILLSYLEPSGIDIEGVVDHFYSSLEGIYQNLRLDANKINAYDPASHSVNEVIVSYPGFYAIAVYRIANHLSRLGIPVLPRILSEYAHGKTGVDIHPNAQIGVPFMIDHGTGIVIGSTTIIGKNVSIIKALHLVPYRLLKILPKPSGILLLKTM